MQKLNHQTGETLEGSRDTDRGRNLNQDTLGSMDIYLEFASLVDGRVEQGKETLVSEVSMLNADKSKRVEALEMQSSALVVSNLVSDIWSSITYVAVHFAHDSNMFVAVEQGVLLLALNAIAAGAAVRGLVCLETGIGKDNDESLRVLVGRGNRRLLFSDQLGKSRGRERLSAWQDGRVSKRGIAVSTTCSLAI